MPDDESAPLRPDAPPRVDGLPPDGEQAVSEPELCPVVGIGASAGGLEAFGDFLRALPNDTGMAFVLVQHLDPHHRSALAELLSQRTQLPVVEVLDRTAVRPNHVYVIPPNTKMTIARGVLRLSSRAEAAGRYMPIDAFLCSLAKDRRGGAVGIILSGAASDGTLGLRAIKLEGGITFAQDDSAKFDGMPRSAIAAGVVDFVLAPDAIALELGAIARHPYRSGSDTAGLRQEAPAFLKILRLLRASTGVDFSQYKPNTVVRRMERRIVLQKAGGPEQYLEMLQQNPAEVRALSDDLLINVTEFFRDAPVFEALKQDVIPEILKRKQPDEAIRIWVPGCSTGEELYSIAICFAECLQEAGLDLPMHIFGSDLSAKSIEKARSAVYGSSAVSVISADRLQRFFVPLDGSYQIIRSLRDRCVFAVHNLAGDPPFSRMDLISCRNVLIYLGAGLQQRVLGTLFYALQPKGYLVLGQAERPGGLPEYFAPLERQPNIHTRKAPPARSGFELPAHVAPCPVFRKEEHIPIRDPKLPEGAPVGPLQRQVDRLLLAEYAPPAIVIDDNYRIVEFRGDVGHYLAPNAGEAELDLFRMLRDDLGLHLRAAIEEARQKNMGIRLERVQVFGAGLETITVAVTPVAAAGLGRHFLITFEGAAHAESAPGAGKPSPDSESGAEDDLPERRAARLDSELTSTRRHLQSIIEELRSVNEEAQSSNEELQSSNEELQTAKEELQASNEELQTLNVEMDSRNADLKKLTDDLFNVLTSLHTPILMLDGSLRIRRFTQASEKLLKLIATDVGRPVSDLKPRIDVPDLEEIVRQVVDTLSPHERDVRDHDGRWYSLRVRPYRTSDNHIDGAVLQLIDIDELKKSLEQVRRTRDYASAIFQTVREPLLVLDSQWRIETANRAFFKMFGASPEENLKKHVFEACGGQFNIPELHILLEQAAQDDSGIEEVEIERDFERLGRRTMLLNARRIQDEDGTGLMLLVLEDITERKRAAEARYRRLFEAAKDGILIADAITGEITDTNPFLEQLSGYPRGELVGRKLPETALIAGNPEMESALGRIRGREKVEFPDVVLKAKSGRPVYVEVVANEYAEGSRKVVQFNIRDITERKRFDRKLQHTQKLESLGLLAGGIAHDFNNLLTGIMGNASLGMAETGGSASCRQYLREILNASQRAADLTRQMLAYAGKGRFVFDRIDLSQMVREIEPLIRTSIPKMVAVRLDLEPGIPAIEGDPGQIQQLVMNLIINGAEAIGEGKPGTVIVRTDTRELNADEIQREFPTDHMTPGAYVAIEVRDTGAGMDEPTRARIFDPFFTTKFRGRGLGLAAVSGIVRSHKGGIRVYSSPGRGSSFLVLLPAVAARPSAPAGPGVAHTTHAGGTVLFVDDEEIVRRLAKSALENGGWRVILAENGAEGVELFGRHREKIDLVILDLAMPVMGGEEALERMKTIRASVPVIVSSGYGDTEAARRFSGQEMAGFLQKPYTVSQLLEAIAVVTGRL
jgi:two-component system, chemotaxis family, CheB/CheR fusion protein